MAAGVLALGPTLRLNGQSTSVPLPYRLIANLPLIRLSRQPDRFDVLVTLALAMMVAYGARALLNTTSRTENRERAPAGSTENREPRTENQIGFAKRYLTGSDGHPERSPQAERRISAS